MKHKQNKSMCKSSTIYIRRVLRKIHTRFFLLIFHEQGPINAVKDDFLSLFPFMGNLTTNKLTK